MKLKWKKVCAAALAGTMLLSNLSYAAPDTKLGTRDSSLEETLADGLVLNSTFDADSISGTTLKDESGRGNDGTMVGNPQFVKGIRGTAISFDNGEVSGKEKEKAIQYVTYGKGKDLQFGKEDFSLSFWMKTTNNGQNNGTILSNKDYTSGSNVGWAIGNFNNPNDRDIRINFSTKKGSRVELKGVPANDDAWHHVAAVYDRDGKMSVYLDGSLYKTADMKEHAGTVDTAYDFILGGDGRPNYGMKDCAVDELRVYQKALDAATVQSIYEAEGAFAIVEKMESELAKMEAGSEYSQEDLDEMAKELAEGKAALDSLSVAAAMAAVKALQQSYQKFLAGSKPLASFQLISDVHIENSKLTDTNAVNLIAGLQDMQEMDPDSLGVLNAGDFTQSSKADQYEGFYQIMKEYGPEAEKTIIALGNHDVRGSDSSKWNKDETQDGAYWATAKELYLTNNQPYMPDTDGKTYYDKWLGGYHFIVLNTERAMKDVMYLSEEQLTWLEETLAEDASPNKPIFVLGHNGLNDTHWRSNILSGFGETDAKVKEIFAKYPQVIYMSGHIHNGFGVAEAVEREFGTSVDIPSYNESENGEKSQGIGWHVKIYEDKVVFKARNFKTSTWLPEYDISIPLPGLPVLYQEAKALTSNDYTAESYQKLSEKTKEAEELLNRTYDQSVITAWNDVRPPAESLYDGETRLKIRQTATELQTAMDELELAHVVVEVGDNLYLQAGTDANKTSTQFSNYDANKLRVKFSDGNQSYTRKTLLRFDLSEISESAERVELVLHLTEGISNTNPAKDFTSADVYCIEEDWDSKVTWNTVPKRLEKAASITKANVSGEFVTVDVTEAVKAAKAEGKQSLSFEISCPTEANDNMIDFFSSRAEGKQVPRLASYALAPQKPENPEFVELREKWLKNLLGGKLDQSNEAVQTYIANLNEKAGEYWSSMHKSDEADRFNLWDDLDMTFISGTGSAAKTNSGHVAQTFYRLKDMAIAYATEGCELYQDEELQQELIAALDFMNEEHYSSSDSKTPFFGNWWHWEIGGPIAFMDIALILYDDLTLEQIQNYAAAVNRFTNVCDKASGYPGSPAMTGANLIDKGMAVAQVGILTDNSEKLEHIKKAYKTVFEYVTTGDGFYEDGSYIQHQALAYMGGYGSSLYEKLSILFSVFANTNYELVYEDHAEQLLFDMVFEGIEPFLYNGLFMDMVSGRSIVRKATTDKSRGAGMLDAMMLLGDAMPEEQKARFESMVKYYVGVDEDYYYSRSTHIASLMKANEIMQDDTIQPRSEYVLHKLFGSMDKLVHITGSYGLALSMHSSRTYGHELINDEGKRTWNISDGMTYLYNGDREQYGEGYWATVDPKRLSGTTTEYVTRNNGAGDRSKNVYSWVGGSSVGEYGTAGMHYKTLGNSGNSRSGADVKKSWFLFDDEIVALGSGITSSTGNYVETIVDNRKLKKDGSNEVVIDGETVDIRDDGAESATKGTKLQNTSWISLEGNAENSDIGYYFPNGADIMALKEKRDGNWNQQGTDSGAESNHFATFWFEHGKNPKNADYAYVILPNKDASATEEYAKAADIEILENSTDAHAVRENSLGLTMVNFWNNKSKTSAGITANKMASVTMKKEGTTVTVGVADPTQENTGSIEISLPYAAEEILAKDDNVEVLKSTPFVTLAVKTAGLTGQSSSLTIRIAENQQTELLAMAEELEPIKAEIGTKFAELNLPKEVKMLDNLGATHTLAVSWERGDYNKDLAGTYELEGTLTLPEGLSNSANIKARLEVQLGVTDIVTSVNVYVQGGSDGDKNYNGSNGLIVKNDKGAQNYTRKAVMKFSLEDLPSDQKEIFLTFELSGKPSADFSLAEVYWVESDWKGSTVTFNSFPDRVQSTAVASFQKADTEKSLVQKLDVSKAVLAAIEAGDEEISFEVSIPTAANNNYMEIVSSRSQKEGVVKPSLVWESDYEAEKVIKKNLSFVVELAKSIDAAEFRNVDEAVLEQLIKEAEAVLADADADMDEIHEAERVLTQKMASYRRK
ncbi:MAG: polysaccharide lyase family 8 super-sandwich domain-containing protein [bacterium]|nr:polysaccharide lyase family 8 super-sandwich domain-containing protein [bacterium]